MPNPSISRKPSDSGIYAFESIPALTEAVERHPSFFLGSSKEVTVGSQRYMIRCMNPTLGEPDTRGIYEKTPAGAWFMLSREHATLSSAQPDKDIHGLIQTVERLKQGRFSFEALYSDEFSEEVDDSFPSPPPPVSTDDVPVFVLPDHGFRTRRPIFGRTFLNLLSAERSTQEDSSPLSAKTSIGFRPAPEDSTSRPTQNSHPIETDQKPQPKSDPKPDNRPPYRSRR